MGEQFESDTVLSILNLILENPNKKFYYDEVFIDGNLTPNVRKISDYSSLGFFVSDFAEGVSLFGFPT
jgi:hypothetical protein